MLRPDDEAALFTARSAVIAAPGALAPGFILAARVLGAALGLTLAVHILISVETLVVLAAVGTVFLVFHGVSLLGFTPEILVKPFFWWDFLSGRAGTALGKCRMREDGIEVPATILSPSGLKDSIPY